MDRLPVGYVPIAIKSSDSGFSRFINLSHITTDIKTARVTQSSLDGASFVLVGFGLCKRCFDLMVSTKSSEMQERRSRLSGAQEDCIEAEFYDTSH